MMMLSTMILTICISMVLKRNRGLSLDIGSRCERAEHKTTLITHLKSWIQSLPHLLQPNAIDFSVFKIEMKSTVL